MILEAAVFLTGVGVVAWLLGTIFDHPEFAIIGGAIVLLVGSMILLGGLEYPIGEQSDTFENRTIENATENTTVEQANTSTDTQVQYGTVDTPARFPLGLVMLLLGALLMIAPMREEGGI